jgi:putative phosphoesterase
MIAVISDSHIPRRAREIPEPFVEKMEKAEKIVHAGDLTSEEVYERVKEHCELVAVKGNCDSFELPTSEKIKVEGVKFGVYHGAGIKPRGHTPTLNKIASEDLEVDVLITGHTHQTEVTQASDSIILNPGSCTGVGGGSSRKTNPTMMTLTTSKESLKVSILEMKDEEIKKRKETIQL